MCVCVCIFNGETKKAIYLRDDRFLHEKNKSYIYIYLQPTIGQTRTGFISYVTIRTRRLRPRLCDRLYDG